MAQPNDFAAMVDLRKGYWQVNCGPPWLLQLRARIKRSWFEKKQSTTSNNDDDEPWCENQHGRNIFSSTREPDITIRGDGSKHGYGGTTTDSHGIQRALLFDKWSNAELTLINDNQYLAELLTLIKLVQAYLTGQTTEWSNTTIHTHLCNPFTANQLAQAMRRPSPSNGFHTLHFEGDNEAVMHRINNAK
eukprot:COSAG05_NODE_822_length_7122_cov_18.423893_7_plen_190_part_00